MQEEAKAKSECVGSKVMRCVTVQDGGRLNETEGAVRGSTKLQVLKFECYSELQSGCGGVQQSERNK